MVQIEKIVIIGAGNVAYHLGKRFHEVGLEVLQVFSRLEEKAQRLAGLIDASYTTDLQNLRQDADLYVLAVSDGAIEAVQAMLKHRISIDNLLVHTSGVTPQTVFSAFPNHGVFYPLQTFSVARSADFSIIPICIDAAQIKHIRALRELAKRISPNVYHITDEQRSKLHVAAVFINNFSNHLAQIAYDITVREGLSFDLLRPLMLETALKIQAHEPQKVQTGPAMRKDDESIQRHLEYLSFDPNLQAIYRMLTDSIQQRK